MGRAGDYIWILMILVSLNLLLFGFASVSEDAPWLLQAKNEFEDPFGVLGSWSEETKVCEWSGITCSKDGLRVIGLNLSSSSLSGTISPALGKLHTVEVLDLSTNSLTEYAYSMRATEKSDVYSLGVVLMELVTGKMPTDESFPEGMDIVRWVESCLRGFKWV